MNIELKRYKREYEHSYSFGVFPTLELLERRPQSALRVALHSRGASNEGVAKIRQLCAHEHVAVEVNDKLVDRLSPAENTYAVGIFSKYEATLHATSDHVVLVNPSDMGNMGTIMRTMAGFGLLDLAIITPAVDVFDPRVVRASMGAIFQLRFEQFERFDTYRERFAGRALYMLMTDGAAHLDETRFLSPFSLVFGNEGAGLPSEFHAMGTAIRIRHTRNIDSLNLPVAVSIALYEATRGTFGQ